MCGWTGRRGARRCAAALPRNLCTSGTPRQRPSQRSFRVMRPDLQRPRTHHRHSWPHRHRCRLAHDALAVLDALAIGRAHVGGLSIGGMVAQAVAAHAPKRVLSLILCDTAMAIPPPDAWHARAATVRADGMPAIADAVMARWVTPGSQYAPLSRPACHAAAHGPRGLRCRRRSHCGGGPVGLDVLVAHAHARPGRRPDAATPPASAQALAAAIPGAKLQIIPGAAHIPTVEQPDAVTAGDARLPRGRRHGFRCSRYDRPQAGARRSPRRPRHAPASPISTATSRHSSPAPPGAASGRADNSTAAPAACSPSR